VRSLSELRGYWNYLRSTEGVPDEVFVFDKLTLPRAGKNGRADERSPFEPADVVRLLKVAREDRQDEALASLIELAMYTGARIEELCALPI
jgi:integrase